MRSIGSHQAAYSIDTIDVLRHQPRSTFASGPRGQPIDARHLVSVHLVALLEHLASGGAQRSGCTRTFRVADIATNDRLEVSPAHSLYLVMFLPGAIHCTPPGGDDRIPARPSIRQPNYAAMEAPEAPQENARERVAGALGLLFDQIVV